jgi:hypothetical protein
VSCTRHTRLPFHASSGEGGLALASFFLCFEQARGPDEWERRLAEYGAHAAGVAMEHDRAASALQRSERRLKAILEQLPVAVGVMDMHGAWTHSNPLMDLYVSRGIPSTQPDRIPRWRAWDEGGALIPPENWPGKRALREER